MKTILGNDIHEVTYIEYQGNIPHTVHTRLFIPNAEGGSYWRAYWWDFFPNDGDVNDIRAYNAGSGGTPDETQAPQWIDGYIGRYWISDKASFNGEVKNGKRLKHPILLNNGWVKSRNPFTVSEVTNSHEYCEECGHSSIEICWEHQYEDNEGNLRYIHANHH